MLKSHIGRAEKEIKILTLHYFMLYSCNFLYRHVDICVLAISSATTELNNRAT